MRIRYNVCKKNASDLDNSRYDKYKNNIKRSIEKQFPNADVYVVDSIDEDSSLDIDYDNQKPSMNIYDQIINIVGAIQY